MKEGIQLIVVDGTPGGGKDEMLRRLAADHWFSRNAVVVNEAAMAVHLGFGIEREEKSRWPPHMWVRFQKIIAEYTVFAIALAFERARQTGCCVVVLNRSIPSGAAYLPNGINQLVGLIGYSREQIVEGVDHVIVPGPPPERFYETNAYRFETYPEAVELGVKARQAYIDLGFVPGDTLHDIPGGDDFDDKCARFMATIRGLVYAA